MRCGLFMLVLESKVAAENISFSSFDLNPAPLMPGVHRWNGRGGFWDAGLKRRLEHVAKIGAVRQNASRNGPSEESRAEAVRRGQMPGGDPACRANSRLSPF